MLRLLLIITLTTFLFSSDNQSESLFTGNANFYYISKLNDGEIIRMPYRMLNTTWANQHKNFEIIGKMALEYQPQNNYSYRMDDPQDFLFDLRELYMTWFLDFGEIRIGKQIQSWGFVDENSPLDNSCAYDYNFLFESGADRKIATTSLSADFYYKNLTFGFTATPFHSINRLPSSKAEFPIELPTIPNDYQFMDIEKTNEYGIYLQLSTDFIDLGASYFSGYDRIFNLSGVNVFEEGQENPLNPSEWQINDGDISEAVDTVLSYRKTDVIGLGATILISDLTLRADIGYFDTKDLNKDVNRIHPNPPDYPEVSDIGVIAAEDVYMSSPFFEEAKYYQSTIQIEYSIFDTDFLFQIFKYDTLSYSSIVPLKDGEQIAVPLFQQEGFDPYNYFFPGMGSPLALMVKRAVLGGVSKSFINDKLTFQLRNLMDLDYKGYFLELNTEYKLTDRVTSVFAINYINGDKEHPNSLKNKGDNYEKALDYPLNQMEDFSHVRMQIKYSF